MDKAEVSASEDHSQNSGSAKHEREHEEDAPPLKLDPRGLPLSPQPTDDPKDPLNWNRWLKLMVLAEVSIFSFLALFSASLIVRVSRSPTDRAFLKHDLGVLIAP